MEKLVKALNSLYKVDESLLNQYLINWEEVSFKRKEFVIRHGETEKYLYFVKEGVQRSYFLSEEKEHVVALTHSGRFLANPKSILFQCPSEIEIECLSDSKMLRIRYEKHDEFLQKHAEMNTLFRKATELMAIEAMDRRLELMSLSMKDRFKQFLNDKGELLNMIPQKHLASYLRIDPTNFSKMVNSIRL